MPPVLETLKSCRHRLAIHLLVQIAAGTRGAQRVESVFKIVIQRARLKRHLYLRNRRRGAGALNRTDVAGGPMARRQHQLCGAILPQRTAGRAGHAQIGLTTAVQDVVLLELVVSLRNHGRRGPVRRRRAEAHGDAGSIILAQKIYRFGILVRGPSLTVDSQDAARAENSAYSKRDPEQPPSLGKRPYLG